MEEVIAKLIDENKGLRAVLEKIVADFKRPGVGLFDNAREAVRMAETALAAVAQ